MKTFRLLIICIFLAGFSIPVSAQPNDIIYLDADNFQIQYQSEVFAILVDASMPRQYNQAHIPGAVLIHKSKKLEAFVDTLDREIPIYLYCDGESRAKTVAEYLHFRGFRDVKILRGGMRYWKAAGLPVETKKKFKLSLKRTKN